MTENMITLTQLEAQVLKSLINNLYAEAGFSDVDAKDIANDINVGIKSVRGALGSLVKKNIISIDNNGAGYEIIYLSEAHYYLHPEWSKEWWASNTNNKILIDLDSYLNQTIKQTKIKVMSNNNNTPTTQTAKRGRPIVAGSKRQAVMAMRDAKRNAGIEVKRGRPKNPITVQVDVKAKTRKVVNATADVNEA
jgi:predicted transcriptional regulator